MTEHEASNGIDVTHTDGSTEHVDCNRWWLGDSVLFTATYREGGMGFFGSTERGPSFPLVSIRKWEESR